MTSAKKDNKLPQEPQKLPFGKGIAENELFSYGQLEELKSILKMAIEEHSMALVTGQAGIGKTTAVRTVVSTLPTNRYLVVYVGQDQEGGSFCHRVALGLGLQPKQYRSQVWMQITRFLSDNLIEQRQNIVLIVDEAHLLDDATLEEVRLLTNADFDQSSPIALILLGQLPLRTRLKSARFEALSQRLRFRYALEGFTEAETIAYIQHRMRIVNGNENLFTPESMRQIFLTSRGIPREINNVCTNAILGMRYANAQRVDARLIRQIIDQKDLN